MSVGEKIKRMRIAKQMTQSELAGDQVSRNMLSLIENDRATPSIQTLEAIAAKLKTTPAFLLAEGAEETALVKHSQIVDVRLMYRMKNYRLAADMCREMYKSGVATDDEIDLVLAESLLENAKEALLSDRVRLACQLLDEAVFYAVRTIYYADHIIGAAWLYFEYMELLSPSLVSENLQTSSSAFSALAPREDMYCRYISALLEKEEDMTVLPSDPAYSHLLGSHVRAKRRMKIGGFEKALGDLTEILRGEDVLPGIMMYHVFADMEECCRRVGNARNADLYRDLKISHFEKLMS